MAPKAFWYLRFRKATYLNLVGFLLWTIVTILPVKPFSYLQPIINGGGPGNWLLLGYLLYLGTGVGGFAAFSAFLFAIETYERRTLHSGIMLLGLLMLLAGVIVGCVLLGVAGALGGYALTIQHVSSKVAQDLLRPYVGPITAASFVAVVGAGLSLYGMATAAKAKS